MFFERIKPSAGLQHIIECYWVIKDDDPTPNIQKIIPDGFTELIKPGQSGSERWTKISGTELSGLGLTMKGPDTVSFEKLKLIVKDEDVFYLADLPENKGRVYFRLTEISETSFTCENAEHDFPKKITYQKDGERLKATISGNGRSINYFFEKFH